MLFSRRIHESSRVDVLHVVDTTWSELLESAVSGWGTALRRMGALGPSQVRSAISSKFSSICSKSCLSSLNGFVGFVICKFSLVGIGQIDPTNLRPFAPPETGGWSGVIPAAALVFVTYLGFAEVNTIVEEIKKPGRNLPLAVLGSLVFVILLYVLVMCSHDWSRGLPTRCWPGRSILMVGSLRFAGQSASGSATKPVLVPRRGLRVT